MPNASQMRMMAILPLLLGVAALAYAGVIAYERHQYLSELKPAVATVGEVVGKSRSQHTVPIDLLAARYTDASGQERVGKIGANEGFKRGDRVEILYSPSNPNFVMLPKYQGSLLYDLLLPAGIGLAFVISAIALYMKFRKRNDGIADPSSSAGR